MSSREILIPATDMEIDEQLLRVFDATPVPMVLSRPDGSFEYVNPALLELLGYNKDEIYQPHIIISHPDEAEKNRKIRASLSQDPFTPVTIDKRYVHKDGTIISCTLTIVAQPDNKGNVLRLISQIIDQTHILRSEEQMRQAALVYENSSEAMLVTDKQNNIIAINPAFTLITGYSMDDLEGHTPEILSSGRHDSEFYQAMWESLDKTGTWSGEIWNRRKNGEAYAEWLTINTIYDEHKQISKRIALFTDITRKKVAEALILQQANYDNLTHLPNSRFLLEHLKLELSRAIERYETGGILFINLDRFKEINESLGHDIGDQLLKDVATRLKHALSDSDFIARYSADEFVVVQSQIKSPQQFESVAYNLLRVLAEPFVFSTDPIYITASIGISLFPIDGDDASLLLNNADKAMTAAKQAGGDCYHYFKPVMQEAARHRMKTINEMRYAIERNQFVLYYQPIIDLQGDNMLKAEALIRWQHPERGLLGPAEFIPLAEETGLIQRLGEWVFSTAVQQVKTWHEQGLPDVKISINVSPLQFKNQSFSANDWDKLIVSTGLDYNPIIIEITENLMMESSLPVTEALESLNACGFQIAIDDFGTGYSSLAYLQEFDADYLKIDKSFINKIEEKPEHLLLCEAIIAMARTLGIRVIAEGIETEPQHLSLKQAGCDFGQGWLYAKALPADQFSLWLSKHA